MKSTIKKIKAGEFELSVELEKDELNKYVQRAREELTKEIKIDGFRKGKAPKDLASKQISEAETREAALDLAVRNSLSESIKEQKLDVLTAENLEIKENGETRLTYTILLKVFPEMSPPDLSGIKVERKKVQVENKEVSDALEVVRASRAKLEDKNGPAEKGDRVEVDFEVQENGKIIEGGTSKNHPVIIGNNNFIPGFEDNLIGLAKGEKKDFTLQAPKDYFNKELAGKNLDFKVILQDVKSVVKPELNDDFAKSLGHFSSVADLEKNIHDGIYQEKLIKEQQQRRLEILSQIGEKVKFEIPEYMVEENLESMIEMFDKDLHEKGLELSLYLAHLQKTQDDLKKEWRKDAEKHAKNGLLIKKIAKEKEISVSPEEVENVTSQRLQTLILGGQIDKDKINIQKLKEMVADELTNEKTLAYLEKSCTA